ncbi:growth hormone receptor-like [Betta splendens]|uniref:Growth hormone receptor-like n=1 Tax=Betta splendens TaxID=158456 RepID=A0A6P7LXF5_BETSP|nr:growth hormone receptor-like [Betta splendens]XP_055362784.1 growth hormone receptor-like [Betta splendens]
MLWLLLALLPVVVITQDASDEDKHNRKDVAMLPHIYYCRSPNMEDFTCWWHPLNNLTDGEEVTHVLTYSKESTHSIRECPDYTTGGPNSCHFDSSHTAIWTVYCMNVTAVTVRRNYTSQEHCLDVADIVQTEAPVYVTYTLTEAGGDEMGHNVLLSWTYPVPSHLQYGWITLVYELQYRRVTEPGNWKVKHPIREPSVELLGLPAGDYVVRVRCRSHNYGLWSNWSSTLLMSVPARAARPPAGKLLLIMVTGVGVVALLGILFGLIPHYKRLKQYCLPPIPKPRIVGIDPLLLKMGKLDEINRHFSNFHSYRPPSYTEEVWDSVSTDDCATSPTPSSLLADASDRGKDVPMGPRELHHQVTATNPALCVQSLPNYCSLPPEAFGRSPEGPALWPRPEMMSSDYSVMEKDSVPNPSSSPEATGLTIKCSPQDFYTCVQLMNESGEVHLVPCLPPAYCTEFPASPSAVLDSKQRVKEKKQQLAEHQASTKRISGAMDDRTTERREAAAPLLPAMGDNQVAHPQNTERP